MRDGAHPQCSSAREDTQAHPLKDEMYKLCAQSVNARASRSVSTAPPASLLCFFQLLRLFQLRAQLPHELILDVVVVPVVLPQRAVLRVLRGRVPV